ncbi:hypothetical protein AVEN_91526-1 [Araneus ventricosus]|uniref:Uncharacterized protein n=1 Tax=Araneus ventricosus TaxID=182803 RepID=A0A4Y2BKP9_ARAVE|nr:hypothetical protein AVEN_91526-1 [Araneus ventricosus]
MSRHLPQEVRTITGGGTHALSHYCTHGQEREPLICPAASYPCTGGAPRWESFSILGCPKKSLTKFKDMSDVKKQVNIRSIVNAESGHYQRLFQ